MTKSSVECQNCGAMVSDDFARVFGDNDDQVHRCPECAKRNGTSERKAADASDRGEAYPVDKSQQAQEVQGGD